MMQFDTVINLLVSYLVRLLVGLSVKCQSVRVGNRQLMADYALVFSQSGEVVC